MGKGWERLCEMDIVGGWRIVPSYKYVYSKVESEFLSGAIIIQKWLVI